MISAPSPSKKLRVLIAMGTRPEIIKQAPLVWAARERSEAVFSGAAELVGTDRELIVRRATELLTQASSGVALPARANPFGDGTSGKKIIQEIISRYGAKA